MVSPIRYLHAQTTYVVLYSLIAAAFSLGACGGPEPTATPYARQNSDCYKDSNIHSDTCSNTRA